MTGEEYRAAVLDVAFLAACAVNDTVPDAERVGKMDPEKLFKAADRHMLTGITAMALESAGVRDDAFTQAKGKAVFKAAAFDAERGAVLAKFEEEGIMYAPMKGCVLKELYPKLGMRQMSDNDILYDDTRTHDVKAIMESLGFSAGPSFGRGVHDHYFKPPVLNFEMHRSLFGVGHNVKFVEYYKDVKSRLIRNEGSRYGYHFSDEDFYIYMIAHEYKHYSGSGTGLRSLLDTYVFLKKKGEGLDWSHIAGELEKLDISAFEEQNRSLAMRLFSGDELTGADIEMLDYIASSGTYGTWANRAKNQVARKGRAGYLFSRMFLPLRTMKTLYPVLDAVPVLLPFCWIFRLVKALITKPRKVLFQLKAAFR